MLQQAASSADTWTDEVHRNHLQRAMQPATAITASHHGVCSGAVAEALQDVQLRAVDCCCQAMSMQVIAGQQHRAAGGTRTQLCNGHLLNLQPAASQQQQRGQLVSLGAVICVMAL